MQGVMRMNEKMRIQGGLLFHFFYQGRSPGIFVGLAAEVGQKGR